MNRRLAFLFLFIAMSYGSSHAQSAIQRLYSFGLDTNYASVNIAQYTEANFFIAAGNMATYGVTPNNFYLATLDYNLNIIKKKLFYFPGLKCNVSTNNGIAKVSDDKYVVAGTVYDVINGLEVDHPFLFMFNKNLDSLGYWAIYNNTTTQAIKGLVVDKQKNILVTGWISRPCNIPIPGTQGVIVDTFYTYVRKMDSSFNLIWEKGYLRDRLASEGDKIILGNDSASYLVSGTFDGYKNPITPENPIPYYMKLDNNGNYLWDDSMPYLYRPLVPENICDINSLGNGKYAFVTSYNDIYASNNCYAIYGVFNEQGSIIWSQKHQAALGVTFGVQVIPAGNGDLLLLTDNLNYISHQSLIRTDSNGNIKQERLYEYTHHPLYHQSLFNLSIAPNNRLLLSGVVQSTFKASYFDTVGYFSWFVVTDSFGCLDADCQLADTMWHTTGITNASKFGAVKVYPNPANSFLTIEQSYEDVNCIIYNSIGQQVKSLVLHAQRQAINIEDLSSGVYIIKLQNKQGGEQAIRFSKE